MSVRRHPNGSPSLALLSITASLAGGAALSLAATLFAGPVALQHDGALITADTSYFFGLVRRTPMVHLPMPGVTSYAQLIQRLQSEGYTDIKVTPLSPNMFDPRPELLHPDLTFTSAENAAARNTAIHFGWNGTAVKDGTTVEVYVDRADR
jgi:hypothetical protein